MMNRATKPLTFMACLLVAISFSGCSWLAELVIVNTTERKSRGRSRAENVRNFEERFLHERDWKAKLESNKRCSAEPKPEMSMDQLFSN